MAEKVAAESDISSTRGCRSCWGRVKAAVSLTKEGASPVNWKCVGLCVVALFASSYCITFLFPFLPNMILSFGYKEEDKGYYSGLIASSMFFGRAFGSYFWGWLSDRWGRKKVMLVNLLLLAATNIAFGFCTSQWSAMLVRVLNGLVNGVVGTCKVILYEVSDNSNQAVAISCISLAWGCGLVLGTSISGFLAEPAVKYPHAFSPNGLFGTYAFLLPSLLAAAICIIAFAMLLWKLPETHQHSVMLEEVAVRGEEDKELGSHNKGNKDATYTSRSHINKSMSTMSLPAKFIGHSCLLSNGRIPLSKDSAHSRGTNLGSVQSGRPLGDAFDIDSVTFVDQGQYDPVYLMYGLGCSVTSLAHRPKRQTSEDSGIRAQKFKSAPDLTDCDTCKNGSHVLVPNGSCKTTEGDAIADQEEPHVSITKKESSLCACLRDTYLARVCGIRDVRLSVALYTAYSFGVIGMDEILTVWCSTKVWLGGLGLDTSQIGLLLSITALPMIVLNLYIFPKAEGRFGALRTFQYCTLSVVFVTTITAGLRPLHGHPTAIYIVVGLVIGIQKIGIITCFSASALLVNNSATPDYAGTVNGLAMMMTAISRTLAPTIGGSIFSWSVTDGTKLGFPFDVNCVFIFFGFIFVLSNVLCAFMPEHLNRQKKKQG